MAVKANLERAEVHPRLTEPADPDEHWSGLLLQDGTHHIWPTDTDDGEHHNSHVGYMHASGIQPGQVESFLYWNPREAYRWTDLNHYRDSYEEMYREPDAPAWFFGKVAWDQPDTSGPPEVVELGPEHLKGKGEAYKPVFMDRRRPWVYYPEDHQVVVGPRGAFHNQIANPENLYGSTGFGAIMDENWRPGKPASVTSFGGPAPPSVINHLNERYLGSGGEVKADGWHFAAYGDSKYNPDTTEWEDYEDWEPGHVGKGLLYLDPWSGEKREPQLVTWKVDYTGDPDDPNYHHWDMIDRTGGDALHTFEIAPDGALDHWAGGGPNADSGLRWQNKVLELDPRLKPSTDGSIWHFGGIGDLNPFAVKQYEPVQWEYPAKPGETCYIHPDRPAVQWATGAPMCEECTRRYQQAKGRLAATDGEFNYWKPDEWGKGFVLTDGRIVTWNTDAGKGTAMQPEFAGPHHADIAERMGLGSHPEGYDEDALREQGYTGGGWHTPVYIEPDGTVYGMDYWPDAENGGLEPFYALGYKHQVQPDEGEWHFAAIDWQDAPQESEEEWEKRLTDEMQSDLARQPTDDEIQERLTDGVLPGQEGKGLEFADGHRVYWKTDGTFGWPHHDDVLRYLGVRDTAGVKFLHIDAEGNVEDLRAYENEWEFV